MGTTLKAVKLALVRAGLPSIHAERGNARGEVVVDGTAVWTVKDALRVAIACRLREELTMATKRYLAFCDQCYSGARLETNSRKDANIHATSHGNAYGHTMHIIDRKETSR